MINTSNMIRGGGAGDRVVVNLGCGPRPMAGAINVDRCQFDGVDLILDLENGLAGSGIPKGSVSEIHAVHVLEHIRNLVPLMTDCLTVLKEGGTMHITVPYDLSYGAWQDPTHVRAFNERSWAYFTEWASYLGWSEWRFDLVSGVLRKNDTRKEYEFGCRRSFRPRAIDEMSVVLRKVAGQQAGGALRP